MGALLRPKGAAEVSRCQQELDHTVQAEATAQEAFDAAEAEKQELKKDVKAKAKAVASFEVDAAKIISDRDDAVSTLEEFRSGPLAAFAALKVFSSARNYKTLEAKRALADAFDLFLCDNNVAE